MRIIVVVVVTLVFFRHLQGAVRTFSIVKGERPALKVQLFPLAMGVILYQASRAPLNPLLVIPGLAGFAVSLALFEWARTTVRGWFFSYACSNDQPQFLLRTGPFAYIRNPFYTSYLVSYASAAIMLPGVATLLVLVGMIWFLSSAARQEERKFETSPLAEEYAAYKKQAGRFFPRLQ